MTIAQVYVEDDAVILVDEREQPCLLTGVGDVNGISVLGYDPLYQRRDRAIVVCNKYANGFFPFGLTPQLLLEDGLARGEQHLNRGWNSDPPVESSSD